MQNHLVDSVHGLKAVGNELICFRMSSSGITTCTFQTAALLPENDANTLFKYFYIDKKIYLHEKNRFRSMKSERYFCFQIPYNKETLHG